MSQLITSIAELRSYVPIQYAFEWATVAPKLREVERTYLVPVLGQDLLDELEDHLNSSTSAADAVLDGVVALAREAEANLAVLKMVPLLTVQVGDAGLHITQSENYRPPFQWQVGDLKAGLHESGMAALEALYQYLEANAGEDSLTTWANGSARSMALSVLLPGTTEFQRHYNIGGSRITFVDLLPAQRRATDLILRQQLGTDFVTALLDHMLADESSGANTYMDTALEKVQAALAHLTIAEAKDVVFRYVNGGLLSSRLEHNSTNSEKDGGHEVVMAQRRAALDTGMSLLALAQQYCDDHADELTDYTARTSADSLPVVEDRIHNAGGFFAV